MIKKVLITGDRGMLGREVVKIFAVNYSIIATDVEEMDITDVNQISSIFHQHSPELVLHLAAMTDVTACEKNPQAAYEINTKGTKLIAQACHEYHIPLLYLSTSDIFDGTKTIPYNEEDKPNPINQYGKSKYAGELCVRELVPDAYIVRTCWLFGGGEEDKKFVAQIIRLAMQNSFLTVVKDTYGSPTYTKGLAQGILKLVEKGQPGTYHLANQGNCSRYELAKMTLKYAGIKNCRLEAVLTKDYPTSVLHPRMAAITSVNLKKIELNNIMRPWEEALKEYVLSLIKQLKA